LIRKIIPPRIASTGDSVKTGNPKSISMPNKLILPSVLAIHT